MKTTIIIAAALAVPVTLHAQGNIAAPSGAPVASMKTLQQVWDKVGVLETQLGLAQASLAATRNDLNRAKVENQLIGGLLSTSAAGLALPWNIQTIATGGVGRYCSLAFGPDGQPAVSHYRHNSAALLFTRYTGSAWTTTIVDSPFVGSETSLAFGLNGQPAISYYDGANANLKYATYNGTSWTSITLDSIGDVGKFSSLGFDPSGNPSIAYYDVTNADLKIARFNGLFFNISVVDGNTGNVGTGASLAFGPNGQPSIAYKDSTNNWLKIASFNGSTWSFSFTDPSSFPSEGDSVSLAFQVNARPAVSFKKVAIFVPGVGGNYSINVVSGGSIEGIDVGQKTSTALGPDGFAVVSYYDQVQGDLKFSRDTTGNYSSWLPITVDNTGDVGRFNSLAFGPDGQPSIAYSDDTNGNLKIARKGIFKPAP